jgi:alkaline phosphatase D
MQVSLNAGAQRLISFFGMVRRDFLKFAAGASFLLAGCKPSTEPPADERITKRIAFGSCADQDHDQPIWDVIGAASPDSFVFLGDNIYADTEDMALMASRYKQLADKPEFARFRGTVPIYATWDDHDFGINDGGMEYPKKQESKKQMLDFFKEPANSERWGHPGVYGSHMFGPANRRVQLILLDLRWFRTHLIGDPGTHGYLPNHDPNATIMGGQQWAWLEQQLQKPARVRIIASSTQFCSPDHPWEKWANFPADKQRMLQTLDRFNVRNAVFISGDMHYAELSSEHTPAGFTVYDLTSSGMNYFEAGEHYPNRNRISIHDTSPNFGVLDFDWQTQTVTVSLQVRNDKGQTVIRRDVVLFA